MDIANPAVRRFQWLAEVRPALEAGYAAIAFDNLSLENDAGRCGHYNASGAWVKQYSGRYGDPLLRADVIGWARHFGQLIHSYPSHRMMWINFSYDFSAPFDENLRLMSTAELVLDERGVTNWGYGRRAVPTRSEWELIFRAATAIQTAGRCYDLNGEEPHPANAIRRRDRLWIVANYLLLKGRCTFMYISGSRHGVGQYGSLHVYPEYRLPIGHPVGRAVEQGGI